MGEVKILESVNPTSPYVLYIGGDEKSHLPEVPASYKIVRAYSESEIKNFIHTSWCNTVIVEERKLQLDLFSILSICKTLNAQATRIVVFNEFDDKIVFRAVNDFGVYKCLYANETEDFGEFTAQALSRFNESRTEKNLLGEIKHQNTELEEFNLGLEKIVESRTRDISQSKKAVEKHVSLIRGLNRFMKDLSGLVSLEEILILLRKELKRFHKVSAPIFAVQSTNDTPKLFYFHGANIHSLPVSKQWPPVKVIRKNSHQDQTYLANEIGRPLGTVLTIPLTGEHGDYVLYIENSLSEKELEDFFAFLGDRISSLETTLERIVLDEEIHSASFMWESTFDGIDNPVVIVDEDYKMLRQNKYFSANTNICYKGLGNTNEVCPGCPLSDVVASKMPKTGKIEIGERKYMVHSYPVPATHSGEVLFVNFYIDITKSEKLHGQVIQNEKMSAVGNLADHIAHELNNPLTGIRSLAQVLLSEGGDNEQFKADMLEVEKAAKRSQVIINNLLDFSKGGVLKKTQVIDLSQMVEKTIPFLKSVMGYFERDIDLSKGVFINVDPQLIQQVVFNLINNACQALGEEGLLSIQVKQEQDQAVLRVKDNGPGIDPKHLEYIFEPFFTTKKEGEGTGLGLSVCKNIIENSQGTIEVISPLNQGTEFIVRFPLAHRSDLQEEDKS